MDKIFMDSREKPRAVEKIICEFQAQDIKYFSTKLFVGDYMNPEKPLLFIDRKQNLQELAQNATSGHARVKRELERLDEIGGRMYFLIEQEKIDGKPIESLEDVILWMPKYGEIVGERIYKVLSAWKHKHNVDFVFCNKRNTGKEIIRLLESGNHVPILEAEDE